MNLCEWSPNLIICVDPEARKNSIVYFKWSINVDFAAASRFQIKFTRERLKCSAIIAEFIVFFLFTWAAMFMAICGLKLNCTNKGHWQSQAGATNVNFSIFFCYTCVTSVKNSPSNCQYKRIKTFAIATPVFIDCLWHKNVYFLSTTTAQCSMIKF